MVLGAPDGAPARRLRAAMTFTELRYGESAWFTGSKVDAYITRGFLSEQGA